MTAEASGPVIVTGGAGAIGSHLATVLAARGQEVRVVDNLASGQRDQLPLSEKVTLTVADLRRPAEYEGLFRGVQDVWHLAANPDIRKGTADPTVDLENGTLATFHLLETCRRHDIRRVLFSSSSVVYGQARVLPTPEEYGPLQPESLYAAAKLACEGLLSAYAHSYGLRVHIFRFANIIGGRMNHGILPDFLAKLRKDSQRLEVLGDGRQAKSYLRTEDCVEGMLMASERATDPVNIFNLGAADRISVREIAEKVVAATGGTARIEYTGGDKGWTGDVPQQLLSIERMGRLGWKPRYSSAGAIDRTLQDLLAAAKSSAA
ncbi:MAG: NAD-dependent epimerase/dehydratase family protein [Thermoplasmata archaeon]|nr:NAD-dependent epimerase/dehydratase family protein [Thermoplasmata archaeon]